MNRRSRGEALQLVKQTVTKLAKLAQAGKRGWATHSLRWAARPRAAPLNFNRPLVEQMPYGGCLLLSLRFGPSLGLGNLGRGLLFQDLLQHLFEA